MGWSISEERSANRLANARRTVLLELPAAYRVRIAAIVNEPPWGFFLASYVVEQRHESKIRRFGGSRAASGIDVAGIFRLEHSPAKNADVPLTGAGSLCHRG